LRFDVYPLPAGGPAGFLVDVQAEFLSHLPSRMVIPLIPVENYKMPIRNLHPVFEIDGKNFILMTHELASVRKQLLRRRRTSLAGQYEPITRALDILFTGF